MEGESSQQNLCEEQIWEEGVTIDVTTMVACIDSLETTMHLILDQMKHIISKRDSDLVKAIGIPLDKEMQRGGLREPKTSTRVPVTRWQLKDLKPLKSNGNIASHMMDVVEKWLFKWEQCFLLCNITDDVAKIQQAMYNLLDVAHDGDTRMSKIKLS